MSDKALPPAFADLQHFVSDWALKGQRARYTKMISVGIAELEIFYNAVLPRIDAIVTHLNDFELDAMPPAEQALMDLSLTFAETAHPVDFKWPATQFDDVFPIDRVELLSRSEAW